MLYAIDRIEGDITVLENIKTKELVEISTNLLPAGVKDGTIVKYENGNYILDKQEQKSREDIIREKFEMLKNIR